MKTHNRKSVIDSLRKYDYQSNESKYIEVAEWANGEGWDISIDDKTFSLHRDHLQAINYLTMCLEYSDDIK